MFSISFIDRMVTNLTPRADRSQDALRRKRRASDRSDEFRKKGEAANEDELDTYVARETSGDGE